MSALLPEFLRVACTLLMACAVNSAAFAQQSTLPAINDSPTAQALYDDVLAQAKENPDEAARLARRLLDEYGGKVLRVNVDSEGADSAGLFRSVADETELFLLASPTVLARFREMEAHSAESMLANDGVNATASRRRLTRAGLVATLRAAQETLQADRAAQALSMLSRVTQHPDLQGAEAVGYYALTASAAARIGLDTRRDEALAQLAVLAAQRIVGAEAAIASARATTRGTEGVVARSSLSLGEATEIPSEEWRQVWSLDLDGTLYRRLFEAPIARLNPRAADVALANADWMTTVPVVLGSRIFLNEGQFVRAIDIDSRDEVWSRALGSGGMERSIGSVNDLSALAVDEGALVTYEGHAYSNMRNGPSRVWCLDPRDGSVHWSVDLDRCEDRIELAGLFPVGTPMLLPGIIVVCARKPTQRLEQVDWLIGLNRVDGTIVWATSIAGAPGTRAMAGRRQAGMSSDGEAIIVATPLGATARVRASDGAIEWLRRSSVPLGEARFGAEPWEMNAPVVIGDRVLSVSPDETEIVALDRLTGTLIDARPIGPGTQWTSPRYLMVARAADGAEIVLAIGNDIAAFDARDLSKRLWLASEKLSGLTPARAGVDNRSGVRGRVSAAGSVLLVPGLAEFLVLNAGDGSIRARIFEQKPGNAVMLADRVVSVGDESVRVLMPPTRAEEILRARLAANPDDPASAIALFDLATRTSRFTIALESARAAQLAFERGKGSETLREELIEHLIALASVSMESGDAAYAIINALADTPKLRVRAALANGDFLRSAGRVSEAVELWRALAAQSAVHDVDHEAAHDAVHEELYVTTGASRSVRLEALRRIAQFSARDTELIATFEASAAAALALLNSQTPTSAQLIDCAMAFPRTEAAVSASRAAAASLTATAARAALTATLEECLIPPARRELVDTLRDAIVELALPAQRDALRAQLDRRIGQLLVASGVLEPQRNARAVRYPRIGADPDIGLNPGKAIELRGRVARFDGNALDQRDPSLILSVLDGSLTRLQPSTATPVTLEPSWRLRLDDRDPIVLWARDRIVVWQAAISIGDSATIVDPTTGAVIYSTPKSTALWIDADADAAGADRGDGTGTIVGPGGEIFIPSQVLPRCDGESLVLIRRGGQIARFGVGDALPTPTTSRGILSRIYTASLYDGLVTIAGRGVDGDSPTSTVAVLDARTLEERTRFQTATGEDVRWAFATALGEVFVGTMSGIERWTIDAAGLAHVVLATTTSRAVATDSPILLGGNLLVAAQDDRPTLIPIFEGDARTVDFPDSQEPGAMAGASHTLRGLIPVPEGVVVHATDRLMLLSSTGEIAGVDSSSRERNYAFALPTDHGVLLLDGMAARQVAAADGAVRVEFPYILQHLSRAQGLRIESPAFELRCSGQRVDRALLSDGWLLLSSNFGLTAVPLQETRTVTPP